MFRPVLDAVARLGLNLGHVDRREARNVTRLTVRPSHSWDKLVPCPHEVTDRPVLDQGL